jgi:hypothetical protein
MNLSGLGLGKLHHYGPRGQPRVPQLSKQAKLRKRQRVQRARRAAYDVKQQPS